MSLLATLIQKIELVGFEVRNYGQWCSACPAVLHTLLATWYWQCNELAIVPLTLPIYLNCVSVTADKEGHC